MYAKFRILLTLFVFVNVNVKTLCAIEAETETSETKSSTNLALATENANDEAATSITTDNDALTAITTTTLPISAKASRGRSIAENYDNDDYKEAHKQLLQPTHSNDAERPLKNVFSGIYKSYRSTYMGNGTSAEYKKRLIERLNAAANAYTRHVSTSKATAAPGTAVTVANERLKNQTSLAAIAEPTPIPPPALETEALKLLLKAKLRKRKRKYHRAQSSGKHTKINTHFNNANINADNASDSNNNTNSMQQLPLNSVHSALDVQLSDDDKHYRYAIGPGVNVSFDMLNDIVNVNLDGDNLREIMRGRWLSDNSEEGRGKKYDMVTKVLPLFVLPFLIQSAIVPFLVTKLKLLLVKSILIGKLAIFLLILSAIRNSNKAVQSYEVAPSYWAGEPSRRSELAAVASSSAAYNGYRVEGKPAAWIN
ncbi:PREDICTED: uncharacterized protein LOC108365286 [Rhagoletis zephyria]|uniref:uncharacterized protein LOC108365286 n=1 Tax=Rhagoletis zephyria TaxID=28612 RepID=UPI0008119C18|nr:PREDICTED: uncharacterized protein LOC108365286 [Rhagoletis zephyria]